MCGNDLLKAYNFEYGKSSIIGNDNQRSYLREWLTNIYNNKRGTSNCLIITGHSGVGKTHCVQRMCDSIGFFVNISFALDNRNKVFYNSIFKNKYHSEIKSDNSGFSVIKKRMILVFDEIDNDTSLNSIHDYLKSIKKHNMESKIPIIIIGNNRYDSKFSSICPKYANHIHFEKLTFLQSKVIYDRIVKNKSIIKKFNISKKFYSINNAVNLSTKLIKESNGDARYLMNLILINNNDLSFDTNYTSDFNKEESYNLWEIYDVVLNRDVSVDDLIRISSLESNWIVNGIFENYLELPELHDGYEGVNTSSNKPKKKTSLKADPRETNDLCGNTSLLDISVMNEFIDNLSFANIIETNSLLNYTYLNLIQNYVRCISLYPINSYLRKNKLNISYGNLKFPSYFGKISNNKITEISVKDLLLKLREGECDSKKGNDFLYGDYFRYIVIEKKILEPILIPLQLALTTTIEKGVQYSPDLAERDPDLSDSDIIVRRAVENFKTVLSNYNLDYDDFYTLLRPHVFGLYDLRKFIGVQVRKVLKMNI
tara:strand:+ start:912 stop:2531 length:1620 start_codon:yes stop_codon:yes gene_type:complete